MIQIGQSTQFDPGIFPNLPTSTAFISSGHRGFGTFASAAICRSPAPSPAASWSSPWPRHAVRPRRPRVRRNAASSVEALHTARVGYLVKHGNKNDGFVQLGSKSQRKAKVCRFFDLEKGDFIANKWLLRVALAANVVDCAECRSKFMSSTLHLLQNDRRFSNFTLLLLIKHHNGNHPIKIATHRISNRFFPLNNWRCSYQAADGRWARGRK